MHSCFSSEIVIVDDNLDDLRLLSRILESCNYKVRATKSASLALLSLKEKTADLILLDCRMPEIDGFEFYQKLKEDSDTAEIPVIFISALREGKDIVKGLRLGAVDFISKPYIDEEIIARIKVHLELKLNRELLAEALAKYETSRQKRLLRESFFERIIDNINSPFWISCLDSSQIFYVNQAYQSVWGRSVESLRDSPLSWIELLHPEDISVIRGCLDKVISNAPESIKFPDYRLLMPDHSIKWIKTKSYKVEGKLSSDTCYAWISTDITERKNHERNLSFLAHHDPLTGLKNRLQLPEKVKEEIARSERGNHELSIMMIDIDHFKAVNDSFGHSVGDEALCSLADILSKAIRSIDCAFRYGGEEFVVVLPGVSVTQAREVAERIRSRAEEQRIKVGPTTEINITVSIGISAFPADGKCYNSLVNAADLKMFSAKNNGRNCVKPA